VLLCGDSGVCYRRAIGSMSSQVGRGGGRDRDKNMNLERKNARQMRNVYYGKTSGGNIGDNATGCSAQALTDSQSVRNPVESAINNTATIATIVTDSVPEQSDETLTMTSDLSCDPSTDAYSCDLGMWPPYVSDSLREYWVAKGSSECRNLDADFSASSSKFEEIITNASARKACSRTRMSSQNSNTLEPGSVTRHLNMQFSALHVN
ncbi:Hypothetical predicted protein, partial [Paramuricea clavata]